LGVELEAGIEMLPLLACELGLTSPLGVVRARLNEGEGGPAAPQAPGWGDGGPGLPLWLALPFVMTLSARCRFWSTLLSRSDSWLFAGLLRP
jgi:hypothetical protein